MGMVSNIVGSFEGHLDLSLGLFWGRLAGASCLWRGSDCLSAVSSDD